jgi:hypothetical protein
MSGKSFEYKNLPVGDIELDLVKPEDARGVSQGSDYLYHGGSMVRGIVIDGESIQPTDRFWTSLYARFGLNKSFFKFFDHTEVFKRVADVDATGMVRVCIERNPTGSDQLLAATGLNKPVVVYDDLMELLDNFGVKEGISYHNGIVTSNHQPRVGSNAFTLAGDKFSNKFVLHCPIDGFGNPNVYLSLLRWICSNGMVGYANSFKTSLALGAGGDNIRYTLTRTLDSFNNDEGYAVMRDRFETAANSHASLREQQSLYRILLKLQNDPKLKQELGKGSASAGEVLMKRYEDMTGRPYDIYFREPNMLSEKRQRTLPVECRVYDMMNFATELATHNLETGNARQLQAWVGNMLSGEYDLEDSCDQFDQFRDFFVNEAVAAPDGSKMSQE